MAKQGLAALVSGAKEGYEFVDDRKKEKAIRELIGRENLKREQEAGVRAKDTERMRPGHEFDFAKFEVPQNYLQKLGAGIKNLFSPQAQALPMAAPQAPADPGYMQRTQEQAVPGPEQMGAPDGVRYKHGGSVRHMVKKYANGGRALAPHQGGPGRVAFQPYEHGGKALNLEGEELPDLTDRERYEQTQRTVLDRGTARADAVFDKMHEIGRSNRSIYGAGPEQESAIRAVPVDQPPEQVSPAAPPTGAGGGAPVSVGGGQAPQAVPSTQGPEERDVDFSTEAREVMPEDLASHSSKDWEDERNYWAASAIAQGKDPWEAMKKVDEQQLSGFARYSMQATALIDAGDLEGASRSLYAAYQYFPNGKNVKFGVQKGKDGQRVIVAMGKDEKSDASSGPPQILNRDTITRMVENMQKPGSLRAWTTDWQNTEQKLWEQGFKRDELKEKGRHNRATEGAYSARTAAIGAGGGMKQADYDRAFGEFMDDTELLKLEDPPLARYLARVMTELYQKTGGGREGEGSPSVIDAVMAAHDDGSLEALREQYGLK